MWKKQKCGNTDKKMEISDEGKLLVMLLHENNKKTLLDLEEASIV